VQGVDVPFAFDSGMTMSIPANGSIQQTFDIVRVSAKIDAPLLALAVNGQALDVIADVTFYGKDQHNNDVAATGSIGSRSPTSGYGDLGRVHGDKDISHARAMDRGRRRRTADLGLWPRESGTTVVDRPRRLGLSITMTASPDQLPRDGSSQSVITLSARNPQNQPIVGERLSLSLSGAPDGRRSHSRKSRPIHRAPPRSRLPRPRRDRPATPSWLSRRPWAPTPITRARGCCRLL
jgi:hypothetical protein